MMEMQHFAVAGALTLLLAGVPATGALAQSGTESGKAPSAEQGQMMENMNHGNTSAEPMDQSQTMEGMDHGNMGAGTAQPGSTAAEAYRDANAAMHAAMDIELTGNADIDFVRGMIAHHQGAIEMSQILLEHGQDPELRQLAEAIIEAQEAEVEFLQAWLTEHAE